jgi:hypothetical protein
MAVHCVSQMIEGVKLSPARAGGPKAGTTAASLR